MSDQWLSIPVTEFENLVRRAAAAQQAVNDLGAGAPLKVEHEIQRLMVQRLGLEWPPGEPFYSVVELEISRLGTVLAESEAENDQWQKKLAEAWAEMAQLRTAAEHLQAYADSHPCDHMPACPPA